MTFPVAGEFVEAIVLKEPPKKMQKTQPLHFLLSFERLLELIRN